MKRNVILSGILDLLLAYACLVIRPTLLMTVYQIYSVNLINTNSHPFNIITTQISRHLVKDTLILSKLASFNLHTYALCRCHASK